jgi:hypothetical protein
LTIGHGEQQLTRYGMQKLILVGVLAVVIALHRLALLEVWMATEM